MYPVQPIPSSSAPLRPVFDSKRSKREDVVDNVVEKTQMALDAGRQALDLVPAPPGLGEAIDLLQAILDKIRVAISNRKDLESLCVEIQRIKDDIVAVKDSVQRKIDAYRDHDDPLDSPDSLVQHLGTSSGVSLRIEHLHQELDSILFKSSKLVTDRSWLSRVWHSGRDKAAVTGLKNDLEAASRSFHRQGEFSIEALVEEDFKMIKRIRKQQREQEEEDTLRKIPKANADFISATKRLDNPFLENTRNRVFRVLEDWKANHSLHKPICVLTGGAGTGKSTIAAEFAKRLKADGVLGASFFFDRKTDILNSSDQFFSILARQLAESQKTLRPHVLATIRDPSIVDSPPPNFLMEPLRAVAKPHTPIFLVIDGLDECRDPHARSEDRAHETVPLLLNRLFACVRELPSVLRVFMTSRPGLQYIEENLVPDSDFQSVLSYSLDTDVPRVEINDDIEAFITNRLLGNLKTKQWCERNPNVIRDLTNQSDGFFEYASTAVRFLLQDTDDLDGRLKALLSPNKPLGLPTLHNLYLGVLETVFPPASQLPERRKQIKFILGCVAVHLEDTPPYILELLIGSQRDTLVSLLRKLRAVVLFEYTKPNAYFRAIHVTFCEFLLSPATRPTKSDDYHVEAALLHAELARKCIECLSDPGAGATWDSLYSRPHVSYARHNWHIHVAQAASPEVIRDLVHIFKQLVVNDDKWSRSWFNQGKFEVDVYWFIDCEGLQGVFQWVSDYVSQDVARRLADRLKRIVETLDVKFPSASGDEVIVSFHMPSYLTREFVEDAIRNPPSRRRI